MLKEGALSCSDKQMQSYITFGVIEQTYSAMDTLGLVTYNYDFELIVHRVKLMSSAPLSKVHVCSFFPADLNDNYSS